MLLELQHNGTSPLTHVIVVFLVLFIHRHLSVACEVVSVLVVAEDADSARSACSSWPVSRPVGHHHGNHSGDA